MKQIFRNGNWLPVCNPLFITVLFLPQLTENLHRSYIGLPYDHESVNHSVGEYVRNQAHTNGVESFWATLKRGYYGTYHRMSEKHLGRYVNEFAGRHNDHPSDTIDQMASLVKGMVGKKLPYRDLIS